MEREIPPHTVLVLGAGASMPLGFPSGLQLKREIVRELRNTRGGLFLLLAQVFDSQQIGQFWFSLNRSGQPSVDAFVELRQEFLALGKAAIAASPLPREKFFDLFPEDRETWYEYFVNRLPRDPTKLGERLAIVTFNYDRSLEMYLYGALMHRFGLSGEETLAWIAQLPIVHFYGSLGDLPHGDKQTAPTMVAYGGDADIERVNRAASQIRIVGERDEQNAEIGLAHAYLAAAERVIFLGFGYNPTNLRRLLAYGATNGQTFVGSALGLTNAERILAEHQIKSAGERPSVTLDNSKENAEALSYLRCYCWLG